MKDSIEKSVVIKLLDDLLYECYDYCDGSTSNENGLEASFNKVKTLITNLNNAKNTRV